MLLRGLDRKEKEGERHERERGRNPDI